MNTTPEDRFNQAYVENLWGDPESRSGPGSTLKYTEELRTTLPALLRDLGCRTFFDAPCGDLNWVRHMELIDIDYSGGDIVPDMIAQLKADYPQTRLRVFDIRRDVPPAVDFWMCRDVLFHLSLDDIQAVLDNYRSSAVRYFATSHYPSAGSNGDAPTDPLTWRPINLCRAPFAWPEPLHVLHDSVAGFPDRKLAVWADHQFD